MLTALKYIFYTEFLINFRRSAVWFYPLSFYVMVISFVPFTLTNVLASNIAIKTLPGYFWLVALFACIMSIQTIFISDVENGHIEQLILSPIPFSLIIMCKCIAHWCLTQLPLIILTPFLGLLLQLPFTDSLYLCLTLLLGTPIITLVGSFAAALTLGLQQTGVLLSLLILPLITPVIIFGVNIIQQYQAGLNVIGPIFFLMGINILSLTLLPMIIANILIYVMD